MKDLVNTPVNEQTFRNFIFHNSWNKKILYLAAGTILIQFTIFKYLYPFASFIHGDSFNYLETAELNLDVNTYLVGYGRFLRIFSVFTKSDTALVAFQYLLIQASAVFFLFTLFYFYKPNKITSCALLVFMVFNPLFLHMGNLISSDGIFLALSFLWFSLLIWIIHKPSTKLFLLHGLIIFFAFTVRYNAMIYPLIAAVAFMLSKYSFKKRIAGFMFGIIPIVLFIIYTGNKYYSVTGTWQYSPFAGWQLSNNAMYAYRYVDSLKRKPVPVKYRKLDNMIRKYFDTTRDVKKHPQEAWMASTAYMWSRPLPLFVYMNRQFSNSSIKEKQRWPIMGPVYKAYGILLIKTYPEHFIKYFMWPNARKYYAPPVEFLHIYNSAKDSVPQTAAKWFDYKSRKVFTRIGDSKVNILNFYPILSGIINVLMIFSLSCFLLLDGLKNKTLFRKGVIIAATVWLLNAGFTIAASSAALRFQAFPILLTTSIVSLLIDWLCKNIINKEIIAKDVNLIN